MHLRGSRMRPTEPGQLRSGLQAGKAMPQAESQSTGRTYMRVYVAEWGTIRGANNQRRRRCLAGQIAPEPACLVHEKSEGGTGPPARARSRAGYDGGGDGSVVDRPRPPALTCDLGGLLPGPRCPQPTPPGRPRVGVTRRKCPPSICFCAAFARPCLLGRELNS